MDGDALLKYGNRKHPLYNTPGLLAGATLSSSEAVAAAQIRISDIKHHFPSHQK